MGTNGKHIIIALVKFGKNLIKHRANAHAHMGGYVGVLKACRCRAQHVGLGLIACEKRLVWIARYKAIEDYRLLGNNMQDRDLCRKWAGEGGKVRHVIEGVIIAAAGEEDAPNRVNGPMNAQHRRLKALGDPFAPLTAPQSGERLLQAAEDNEIERLRFGQLHNRLGCVAGKCTQINRNGGGKL